MVNIITGWTTCHLTDYFIVFLGSLSSFDDTCGFQELEILSETLITADSRQLSNPPDTHFVELGDSIRRVPTSVAVLAEIPLRSPQKLFIFIIKKKCWVKVSKNKIIQF